MILLKRSVIVGILNRNDMKSTNPQTNLLLLSFIFSPNVGGVETHLDELCEYLLRHNVTITVITYQPIIGNKKAPIIEKKEHITIYRIPWIRGNLFNRLIAHPVFQMLYLIPAIFLFSSLYLLRNNKINIIQSHGFNMAITAYVLSKLFGIPYTVNTHVTFSFPEKNMYSIVLSHILKKARKVMVLTEDAKKELMRLGVKGEVIEVYHYWVDKRFQPLSKALVRKELGVIDKQFLILFVGRFIYEKGVLLLIEAVKKVEEDMVLVLIGSGPLEKEVASLTSDDSRIRVLSSIDRKELPKWYSAADITIIPSFNATDTYAEGIPRVMIESFSCGTPVVATKAGGLKTMLRKDVGLFISPTVRSIEKTIEALVVKRKELFIMRNACLRYAANTFNMEMNARKILTSIRTE